MAVTAPLSALDSSLDRNPDSAAGWTELVNDLWNCNLTPYHVEGKRQQFDWFFSYYSTQRRLAVGDGARWIQAATHRDLSTLVHELAAGRTRAEVQQRLLQTLPQPPLVNTNDQVDSTIDLAARILLMVQVGNPPHFNLDRCDELAWNEGTIIQFLHTNLSPQTELGTGKTRLDSLFNMRNLDRMAGLHIRWTTNLMDHLRLRDSDDGEPDAVVHIFHCAGFLMDNTNIQGLFPDGFIGETLRTLSLLLPKNNPDVVKWYKKQQASSGPLDPTAMELPYLKVKDRRIENFSFWRDRLVILKERFDEAEPGSLRQWAYDKRKRVQFYTFWVATAGLLVTALFSIIQSIEGAIQVYKTYYPTAS